MNSKPKTRTGGTRFGQWRSVEMGRRNFSYPTEVSAAERALNEFSAWFGKVLNKIAVGCGMSAVGTSYEDEVYKAVLKTLHLDQNIATHEFYGELQIHD